MIGPMIIQLEEKAGQIVVVADRDIDLVWVFERRQGGQPLRDIPFPPLSAEEHGDPGQVAELLKVILYQNGWRERVLDEAGQRHMLLAALRDVSVRYMQLEAAMIVRTFGGSPLSGRIQ